MTAGLNLRGTLWRLNTTTDDDVGGAVTTGTPYGLDIWLRLAASRPSQQALEAGLEVERVFDMVLVGRGLNLKERDEVEITWPKAHPYFGQRFRITSVQLDSRRRRYGHTTCTANRIEYSRSRQ